MNYELTVNITIRPQGDYNQGLRIEETAKVSARDFLECAKILGMFHDLTTSINKDQELRGHQR